MSRYHRWRRILSVRSNFQLMLCSLASHIPRPFSFHMLTQPFYIISLRLALNCLGLMYHIDACTFFLLLSIR